MRPRKYNPLKKIKGMLEMKEEVAGTRRNDSIEQISRLPQQIDPLMAQTPSPLDTANNTDQKLHEHLMDPSERMWRRDQDEEAKATEQKRAYALSLVAQGITQSLRIDQDEKKPADLDVFGELRKAKYLKNIKSHQTLEYQEPRDLVSKGGTQRRDGYAHASHADLREKADEPLDHKSSMLLVLPTLNLKKCTGS